MAHEDRGRHLVVAVAGLELAHRALERAPDPLALRMPERGARRHVVEAVQVELDAEPAVVALLRLAPPPQVGVQVLLRRPDRAVDPLEGGPLLVAAPVGARHREELERADLSGALDVRPLAEVDERAVLVDARRRIGLFDAFAFVARSSRISTLNGWLRASKKALPSSGGSSFRTNGWSAATDAAIRSSIARGRPGVSGRGELEVVVEAVLDRRADAELGAREQVQHRLGHHVGGRVAHRVELVVRARVEQLLGRTALGRLDSACSSISAGSWAGRVRGASLPSCWTSEEITKPPLSPTGRKVVPSAVPPAFAAGPWAGWRSCGRANGRTRTGSPVAHGWYRLVVRRRAYSLPGSLMARRRARPDRRVQDRMVPALPPRWQYAGDA